ncbi:MAG: SGNH/GDSL hydrolase family protein [Chromatiales bacterium]|nr:SGNH/GDSL hydrolase family protein [Chromatiales bacterium]
MAPAGDTGNSFIWLSKPENQACGTSLNVPPYDALDEFLVPDGPYATGGHHFTNGATWLEGLARYLALAGNARPAFQNTGSKASNYAVGGARATDYPCRFNLPDQLTAYITDFSKTSPNTLITLEIGGNDVRDALVAAALGQEPGPIIEDAITSISHTISVLYEHGARKFLVLNVPDIGKIPAVLMIPIPGASDIAGRLSVAFNDGLVAVQQAMNSLPDNDVRILDIYGKLNEIIANPSAFGFSNAINACVTPGQPPFKCKKPDTYVFWDGIHPTKAMHDIVAQQAIGVITAP